MKMYENESFKFAALRFEPQKRCFCLTSLTEQTNIMYIKINELLNKCLKHGTIAVYDNRAYFCTIWKVNWSVAPVPLQWKKVFFLVILALKAPIFRLDDVLRVLNVVRYCLEYLKINPKEEALTPPPLNPFTL